MDTATVTSQYLNLWPLTTDGVTVDFDLTDSKSDTTANAPHVLVNNLDFMLKEAKSKNSNFAYQLNLNDDSKITNTAQYRGLSQFALWFLRPNIIRQKSSATTRTELEPMFQELADSVKLIHYNPQIAEFWKTGELISNGSSHLNNNIPEQYKDDPRWFLLNVDENPNRPWSDSTNIKVWAFAIVKGEAPNREWLVYSQSPENDIANVAIEIPNYRNIFIDIEVNGSFYLLSENTSQANILQTNETTVPTESPTVPPTNTDLQNIIIGARAVASTDISLATKFASPTGNGDGTINSPYSIVTAFNSLVAGDVLFLRGGAYDIPVDALRITDKSGTKEQPIIVESYPGEVAILDGKNRSIQDVLDKTHDTYLGFYLNKVEYIHIRKIEITGMWATGILLKGRHSIIEGCNIHDNFKTGIHVINREFYTTPYVDGWNIIRDNYSYNNSDFGIPQDGLHDDGDNADGIGISNGQFNIAHNNTLYGNSDEGIDIWKSNDSEVYYNRIYSNTGDGKGSGIGIKMGGSLDSATDYGLRGHAHHNLLYNNSSSGIVQNAGRDVVINNNISWNNGHHGYTFNTHGVLLQDNIALDNTSGPTLYSTHESRINNSWNIDGIVEFISTNPASPDFLKLKDGSPYQAIGAYTN
ncbi:MAG: hypothetical protein DRG78_21790 [Epsilonproteobacteria bacterium]|nr:MAG: hypothetical protein DRG78_21790 [Campylobacterota bacterium]